MSRLTERHVVRARSLASLAGVFATVAVGTLTACGAETATTPSVTAAQPSFTTTATTLPTTTVALTTTTTIPYVVPTGYTKESDTGALKKGDAGPRVLRLQQQLLALGFSPGTPDGAFGGLTDTQVKAFQKSKSLLADGIVGPVTIQALNDACKPKGC